METILLVRKSRPGAGRGLFAGQAFESGDCIAEYSGVRIASSYADTLKTRYFFELDENWTIDGGARGNIARYINHSCAPNAEAQAHDDGIYIFATRAIASGEEITIDYGDEYFDEFIRPVGCKCEKCS